MYPITYQLYHVVSPIVSYIGWLIPSNYQIITNNAIINITFPWNAQVNLPFSQFSSVNMFFSHEIAIFLSELAIFPGFPQFFHHELPICPMEKQRSARTAEARGELFASEALQWSMALEALQRSCWTLRKAFKGPGKAFECLGVRESKKGGGTTPVSDSSRAKLGATEVQ